MVQAVSGSLLTIRRICHSGFKTRANLEVLRLKSVDEVIRVVLSHSMDPVTRLRPRRAIFYMDQTPVYCSMGSRTTIDLLAPIQYARFAGPARVTSARWH